MAEVNLLARSFRVEVSADGTTWVRPAGLDNFNDNFDDNMESVDDYDTNGWGKSEKTLINWTLSFNLNRKVDAGVEDPGQALLRARRGQFGDGSRIYVRWYRTDGIDEAWSGVAVVSWQRANTSTKDVESASVTLAGYGEATAIANPYSANAVPTVLSVSPSTGSTAGGELVTITGQYFTGVTGATGVKFGSTNATNYTVVSDSKIVATAPAGTAGAVNVVVTNSVGASTTGTGAYTYA